MRTRILRFAIAVGAAVAAFFSVLHAPAIACGFMTIAPVELVHEPGAKVLVGFAAFVASQLLLANLAEVALVITAIAMFRTLECWTRKVAARWTPLTEGGLLP